MRKASASANHMVDADRRALAIRDHMKRQKFLDEITDYVHRHEKDLLRNQWELESDKKTIYSRVQAEMEKIKNKIDEDLEERRNKLSVILKQEDAKYLKEASDSVHEDPQEKRQRMLDRYCALKTQKERKRQEMAREKKEQQFRRNCDELRTQMSRRLQREAAEDSKRIVQERQNESARRHREHELYEKLWRLDSEAKRQREEKEKEERKSTDIVYGRHVEDQIKAKNLEKLKRLREKEEEAEIMAEQKRLMELEELCEKEMKRRKQEEMKKNLESCLREKLKKKSKENQDDLSQDLLFLKKIMDDEDEREKSSKKRALMKEQQEYLRHLKEQMKKEVDYEKEIDRLYQNELDKSWKKRQDEWSEEKQKRRQLEQDVMSGIKAQIQANMEKSKQTFNLNESSAQLVLKEDEEDKKRDAEKLKLIRERNEKHQNELLNQIREKEARLKEERRLNDMESEEHRHEREEEEAKIQKLLSEMEIDNKHPYRGTRNEVSNNCQCCNACQCKLRNFNHK